MAFDTRTFHTSDGLTLTADVAPATDSLTVILLHGGGQTRHSWAATMSELAEAGYGVINYDARGHGDSDWAEDGDYSLKALARDLEMIRSTVAGPVVLIGASMGGMTSFYAIGSNPLGFADALVMVDIAIRPAPDGVDKIRKFMRAHPDGFATVEEAAAAVAAYNPARRKPGNAQGLRKNLRLQDDGRLHWHWDPRLLEGTDEIEPPAGGDVMVGLAPHVLVPVLLVRGAESDIVRAENIAEMRELVPQTQVLEVPKAAHMLVGDQNDIFSRGVIGFLESLAR